MVPSYVHGTSSKPLRGETVGGLFDRVAMERADNEALVVIHQGIRWSYLDLKQRVDRLAGGLAAIGLKPRERVGIWAPNCAEWVVTQFATAKIGLILVNIDTLSDGEPRNNFLDRALTWNADGVLDGARHVTMAGHRAYILTTEGLVVVNLKTPLEPLVETVLALNDPRASHLQLHYLFVTDASGLQVLDDRLPIVWVAVPLVRIQHHTAFTEQLAEHALVAEHPPMGFAPG